MNYTAINGRVAESRGLFQAQKILGKSLVESDLGVVRISLLTKQQGRLHF